MNPLDKAHPSYTPILSEGNLKLSGSDNLGYLGTIIIESGKWYAEAYINDIASLDDIVGVWNNTGHPSTRWLSTKGVAYRRDGYKFVDGSASSYGASWTTGDIIGMAIDLESGTPSVTFYKNGATQGSITGFESGNLLYSGAGFGSTWSQVFNFGQDSSFAGNKTAQGNQDGNEIGDFYYSVPTGFLALCTNNLTGISTPYQAYSSCSTEDEYKEVTYTGNGSSNGPFIYLGFLATNICIDGTNYTNASTSSFDFLSNGIKCRSTTKNSNGTSYTLEAWVDTDFKYNTAEGN
jgi:hypothetical protein